MEKISNIVRGNSRVASVDLKNSSAVRPGVPSFGRPIGESPHIGDKSETTASRANAIQNELNEAKRGAAQDHAVTQMSNEFFNSRVRQPEEEIILPTVGKTKSSGPAPKAEEFEASEELKMGQSEDAEIAQPSGFKPRGTYVDVRV